MICSFNDRFTDGGVGWLTNRCADVFVYVWIRTKYGLKHGCAINTHQILYLFIYQHTFFVSKVGIVYF